MNNSQPGEIILAEIMEPLGLTVENAAQHSGVPADVLTAALRLLWVLPLLSLSCIGLGELLARCKPDRSRGH